ncbi:MAG: ribonuclease Z [Desulfovibrionaceae bacterium]|nr:ribonuclease Z [Desulfovibrionaceae bacterium]
MRATFAGVGEAFDETLPNTSILVETDTASLLLDCGFTAPGALRRAAGDAVLDLDMIYISHYHGDHYFGLPALLVRFIEEGRKRPLKILGKTGIRGRVNRLMDMAYPNAPSRAEFETYFIECGPGEEIRHAGVNFEFALGDHPMPCLAVRLTADGKSLYYSGDGRPTDATRSLAAGCGLVIHEAFVLDGETPGHGSVDSALAFAAEAGAHACALVHLNRTVRRNQKDAVLARLAETHDLHAFLPEPGDTFTI